MNERTSKGFSEKFVKYFQNNVCQCGRVKRNYFALCGICFMSLDEDLKSEIKNGKGFQLEIAFNSATRVLKPRGGRRRTDSHSRNVEAL